jgi:pseudouridine kinase
VSVIMAVIRSWQGIPNRGREPSGVKEESRLKTLSVIAAGGANVDVKVRTASPPTEGRSTPGEVHLAPGGAARNVAEALARMGAEVALHTAVGADAFGDWLIAVTTAAGVDCAAVFRGPGQTGIYVTVNGAGVADASLVESLDPAWPAWPGTEGVVRVLDANLSASVIARLAAPASASRLVLIGTSPAKVARLRPLLRDAWLLCLTAAEAAALLGAGAHAGGEPLARAVAALGPAQVLLTEGARGLGLLADPHPSAARGRWWTHPARPAVALVDPTGAGDVAAAALTFGLAADLAPERILAAAAEAAAMTVGTWGNVPPEVGTVWKGISEGPTGSRSEPVGS